MLCNDVSLPEVGGQTAVTTCISNETTNTARNSSAPIVLAKRVSAVAKKIIKQIYVPLVLKKMDHPLLCSTNIWFQLLALN